MTIRAIAVLARNRVIGTGRDQPFKFPEDWARLKRVTMGHPLIVGRRTHEVMGLLPGRFSIVVTSRPQAISFPADAQGQPRGMAVGSIADALSAGLARDEEVYVIGGGQIYRQAWPYLAGLEITWVHADAEGGVLFPEITPEEWVETARTERGEFDFVSYRRREFGPADAVGGIC